MLLHRDFWSHELIESRCRMVNTEISKPDIVENFSSNRDSIHADCVDEATTSGTRVQRLRILPKLRFTIRMPPFTIPGSHSQPTMRLQILSDLMSLEPITRNLRQSHPYSTNHSVSSTFT